MTGRRRALLLTCARYDDEALPDLHGPLPDAAALRAVLLDADIGAFDEVDSPTSTDGALSSSAFRLGAAKFLSQAHRDDDLVVVYISGHGKKDPDGHLYFATTDTYAEHLDATAVPSEFVRRQVAACRAPRLVLILDCCYSGAFAAGILAKGGEAVEVKQMFEPKGDEESLSAQGRGWVVMTASTATQPAWGPAEAPGPSLFTHALVEALQTGKADHDDDGWVTTDELFAEVEHRLADERVPQTPETYSFGRRGRLRVARNPNPRPTALPDAVMRLVLDPDFEVRLIGVKRLAALLGDVHVGRALAARELLEALCNDDSRSVGEAAREARLRAAGDHCAPAPQSRFEMAVPEAAPTAGDQQGHSVDPYGGDPRGLERTPAQLAASPAQAESISNEAHARTAGTHSAPPRSSPSAHAAAQIPTPARPANLSHPGKVRSVAFSPDAAVLAAMGLTGDIRLWDVQRREQCASMNHSRPLFIVIDSGIAFSPDSHLVASCGGDETARVWEVQTGREVARMTHGRRVASVAFSSDGGLVASGGRDCAACVWEAQTGREVARMTHGGWVASVVFSPDGGLVASASRDWTARVWEAQTGREVARMTHGGAVVSVAYSSDGGLVASASDDKTARVWEAQTGREVARMTHGGAVASVAFSPDGGLIASGSRDCTARVWEAQTGREVAHTTHGRRVGSVAFSPDGRLVASGSDDRSVTLLPV